MDIQTIILSFAAFLISSFLKGLTGLGFSTICLAILASFLDLKLAISLVFLPSLSSNLFVMFQAGRFLESAKRFWLLYLSALPGLIIGISFLTSSQNQIPKAILGAVILIYGIWGLVIGKARLSKKTEKLLIVPVGLLSGLVNGATGSQIMPIMPYLLSLKIEKDSFVQTINCAFTFNTLIMMVWLGKIGVLTLPVAYLSAVGIVPVALGILLGGFIRNRVSEDVYRKIVFILLIVMGMNLVRYFR